MFCSREVRIKTNDTKEISKVTRKTGTNINKWGLKSILPNIQTSTPDNTPTTLKTIKLKTKLGKFSSNIQTPVNVR